MLRIVFEPFLRAGLLSRRQAVSKVISVLRFLRMLLNCVAASRLRYNERRGGFLYWNFPCQLTSPGRYPGTHLEVL